MEFEQAKISFETLLGSEEKALQMLQDIDELASQTPFNKLGLTSSIQQLIGFGFEGEKALATVKVLGDSISAVGRGQDDLNGVILALGQIEAKGKLSTEEVLQMAERGLPIFKVLEEQLGLTKEQLGDLGNQGIDSSTAINAILTGLNEKFAGSMQKQSKTLTGMWSNLVDNVQIAGSKMGLSISDSLKGIIGSINGFLQENMSSIIDFGSDVAKNIINIGKAIAGIFVSVFEIITESFGILTGENKKQIQDNFKLFKYLAMAISNGFQVVYMVINTVLGSFFGAIKTLGTGIGNFLGATFYSVKLAGKSAINYVIGIINSAIDKLNVVLQILGRKTIDHIKEVNTIMEKLVLENGKGLENTKKAWTDSWDKIKTNNGKAFDRMLENIDNYENDLKDTGKTSTGVFDKINTTI
ncbi:MAG: tape measure protein, partial [Candidatus Gracilibacteria bacterium]|nr:tape measure protein [Candidatus Gracilibacteria bacterium]